METREENRYRNKICEEWITCALRIAHSYLVQPEHKEEINKSTYEIGEIQGVILL